MIDETIEETIIEDTAAIAGEPAEETEKTETTTEEVLLDIPEEEETIALKEEGSLDGTEEEVEELATECEEKAEPETAETTEKPVEAEVAETTTEAEAEAETVEEKAEEIAETAEVVEETAETEQSEETAEETAEAVEEPAEVAEVAEATTEVEAEAETVEEKAEEIAETAEVVEETAEAVEEPTEVAEVVEETAETEQSEETAEETAEAVEEPAEVEVTEETAEEEGEEAEESAEEKEPEDKKEAFKLTAPENLEEIMAKICAKRARKLIYRPSEELFSMTCEVLGTDKNNEEKISVKKILEAEIKEGLKLGYLDKFDGLKGSELKEEYENDTVYEYAEQEFKRTGLLYDGKKVKVYVFDWDLKACHHIGCIADEDAEKVLPYILDSEKYSFDVNGVITGGKYKKITKDPSTGKVTVEKGNDGKLGVELDVTVINRKD